MRNHIASAVQTQFYLSSQLHPVLGLNTMICAVRIVGPLSVERLVMAIQKIARHHATLRTRLRSQAGRIECVVLPEFQRDQLEIVERPSDDAALHEAVESLCAQISPEVLPWKAQLLSHAPEDHTLLFVAHRCIWDERSTTLLMRELSARYTTTTPDGAENADAIDNAELRQSPNEAAIREGATRFAQSLADAPLMHGFPLKGPRTKTLSVEARSTDAAFDFELQRRLEDTAKLLGVSRFHLQAAGAVYVLAQFCKQNRLVVGIPFDMRTARTNGALGSLTATLPVGLDATAKDFAALSLSVVNQIRALAPYSETPCREIVMCVGARVDTGANTLCQIAFSYEDCSAPELGDCLCSYRSVHKPAQQLDLCLQFSPSTLRVGYASQIISDAIAASLASSCRALLSAALDAPTQNLSSLTLVDGATRQKLALGLNQTDAPALLEPDLFALVTRHATSDNKKIALTCGPSSVTYAELLGAVESLAQRLSALNVQPQSLVGICLPRSIDMVVTMLAILRCGAAYVPLDPGFPAERLAYMVEHSGLKSIVSTSTLKGLFSCPGIQFVELDHHYPQTATPVELPVCAASSHPAYVIYTSGSTGKPKGVVLPRGAVANFLLSMLERPGIAASDVVCAVTTLSFDIAVLELLGPLCAGGTVVIASAEEAHDPKLLLDVLRSNHVTILQATPVTWQLLCAAAWPGDTGLTALCGGEALQPSLARALAPKVKALWNMYGPTETTVWSTCKRIDDVSDCVSVGMPIHNTTLYVLDDHLRLSPIGVEGRLFIGGSGVALGYLHNEALTNARFLPDPFRAMGRMYDTGDRARLTETGELYVLGRTDFQVKLRGFRIELGEIEAVLGEVRGVKQCAVEARGNGEKKRLVAYLVLDSGYEGDARCRATLGARLPKYMVPTAYVHLDQLPLTATGKLDRMSLPEPPDAGSRAVDFERPKDALEARVLELWQSALGQETVSVTANFFALGGNSLLAVRMLNGIHAQFAVKLPLATLFENPTVRQLGERIRQLRDAGDAAGAPPWTTVVPMRTRGDLPPLFCVAGLGGNTMNLRFLMEALGERQPFYGLQHRGVDGVLPAHRSIEDMAREFFSELRRIQPTGPYYLAGYSTGGLAAYELARILVEEGETVAIVILLDTSNPTTLTWAFKERVRAHLEQLAASGLDYLWARTLDAAQYRIRCVQRYVRARMAAFKPYEYRIDALEDASLEAERNYVARPLDAKVFLVKADYEVPTLEGIGYPPHESNGWRDVVCGGLEIAQIQCSHLDLVSERVAPTTAAILRQSLREARAKLAGDSIPPVSLCPDGHTPDNRPYYVPRQQANAAE